MSIRKNSLVGKKFGRWTVLSVAQHGRKAPYRKLLLLCRCECGVEKKLIDSNIRSGKSLSCGCLRTEQQRLRPFESEYNRACRNIRISGWKMDISYRSFVRYTKVSLCHYCRGPVVWVPYPIKDWRGGYNLDRKNNLLGYTKDNVVVCCKLCNFTKANRFTYEEFLLIAKALRKIQRRRQLDKAH